ncbi:MAG: hypothetical protein KF901_20445 [Myxococcales bacterium]|nr:hypothetical protein [Myxococcales bacterium]
MATSLFVVLAILLDTGTRGEAVAPTRATIDLGRRATAVIEGGAVVAWHVGPGGVTEVAQRGGDVLYRVAEGPPVHVSAGALDVEIHDAVVRVILPAADAEPRVHVLAGRARVRRDGERVPLEAGEAWIEGEVRDVGFSL